MVRYALISFVLTVLVGTSSLSRLDEFFRATQNCIIHEEDNSPSKEVGRLEIGESARVLELNADKSWVKIDHEGVQGWVYKRRGSLEEVIIVQTTDGEMHFFFGNIHSHTGEDNSEPGIWDSTHEDAFLYAMDPDKGNLDFLAVTPHNHLVESDTYANLLVTRADSTYDKPGEFVPIAGQEFSSTRSGNHMNVFELDAWIDPSIVHNGDFDVLFKNFIRDHQTDLTFAQFNHPYSRDFTAKHDKEYGRDDFANMEEWIAATDPVVQSIEVIRAPSHTPGHNRRHYDENPMRLDAWLWAINQGWHLGPAANQDNHRSNWGDASDSRTVAIAPELTREAICEAFRQRRFYATEDSTLRVSFKTSQHWMGSIIPLEDFLTFSVWVHDPEEPNASYTIDIFWGQVGGELLTSDSTPFETTTIGDNEIAIFEIADNWPDTYYFVRVTQSLTADDPNNSEDNAWTAPIWIEAAH